MRRDNSSQVSRSGDAASEDLGDVYRWRDTLSRRLAITMTDGGVHVQATLHWPDETERVIHMLKAAKAAFAKPTSEAALAEGSAPGMNPESVPHLTPGEL